jgi:hypothetical protein
MARTRKKEQKGSVMNTDSIECLAYSRDTCQTKKKTAQAKHHPQTTITTVKECNSRESTPAATGFCFLTRPKGRQKLDTIITSKELQLLVPGI